MKGLASIPSTRELQLAYSALQSDARELSPLELTLWSQWARLDPRLAELWVDAISKRWKKISPFPLNAELQRQPWPSAAGPLLENIGKFKIDRDDRKIFGHWKDCVMSSILLASGELYFIGIHAFAGKAALAEAAQATRLYRRWGYAGTAILLNKAAQKIRPGTATLISRQQRLHVLRGLLQCHDRIDVSLYIRALQGHVARRTAELDLAAFPGLRKIGNTRSACYRRMGTRTRRGPESA